MGLPEDRFVDGSDFVCYICYDVAESPVKSCHCEHYFCYKCVAIAASLETYVDDEQLFDCPSDGIQIFNLQFPEDYESRGWYDEYLSLKMRCLNHPDCLEDLNIFDFKQHDEICQAN